MSLLLSEPAGYVSPRREAVAEPAFERQTGHKGSIPDMSIGIALT
jgi:hypothetical protein